jgi:hypothetical protein
MYQSLRKFNAPAVLSVIVLGLSLGLPSTATFAQELRLDPKQVKGPDTCGECHETSVNLWKSTHHFTTYKDMPSSDKAREIAKKMGVKRVKSGSDCLSCHFTSVEQDGKVTPVAGITCESCHGAGANWIDVHSDFGGKDVKAENEVPAHKVERYKKSEAAGMIRPSNLYGVAENCYSCHTVPNEKLVNTGGHPAGSKFELVAWSQGEVRHNKWYTDTNTEASLDRRRVMFVVGKMLDLEYAYRGLAEATKKATFAVQMAKRAKSASNDLEKIGAASGLAEVKAVVTLAGGIKLKLNNKAEYLKAADAVAQNAKKVAAMNGSALGAIDALLPKSGDYKGTPAS